MSGRGDGSRSRLRRSGNRTHPVCLSRSETGGGDDADVGPALRCGRQSHRSPRRPVGAGAMTGRRAGSCGGTPVPGCLNFGPRRGFGGGRGRGWRHRYYATGVPGRQRAVHAPAATGGGGEGGDSSAPALESLSKRRDNEIKLLRRRAEALKETLGDIASRPAPTRIRWSTTRRCTSKRLPGSLAFSVVRMPVWSTRLITSPNKRAETKSTPFSVVCT